MRCLKWPKRSIYPRTPICGMEVRHRDKKPPNIGLWDLEFKQFWHLIIWLQTLALSCTTLPAVIITWHHSTAHTTQPGEQQMTSKNTPLHIAVGVITCTAAITSGKSSLYLFISHDNSMRVGAIFLYIYLFHMPQNMRGKAFCKCYLFPML